MNRWCAMILACLALALGPSVSGIVAACQPTPVALDSGCGESCCCGDEAQCPCVHRAPDHSDQTPSAPRPTNEVRPLLLSLPGDGVAVTVVSTGGVVPLVAFRPPAASKVRSQARLCRWRN